MKFVEFLENKVYLEATSAKDKKIEAFKKKKKTPAEVGDVASDIASKVKMDATRDGKNSTVNINVFKINMKSSDPKSVKKIIEKSKYVKTAKIIAPKEGYSSKFYTFEITPNTGYVFVDKNYNEKSLIIKNNVAESLDGVSNEITGSDLQPTNLLSGSGKVKDNILYFTSVLNLKKATEAAINKKLSASKKIKKFLLDILNATYKSKGNLKIPINNFNFEDIHKADVNIIKKQFGEITSAIFAAIKKNKKTSMIGFPPAGEKLIDFTVDAEKFSVKAPSSKGSTINKGAAPSVASLYDYLKNHKYVFDTKDEIMLLNKVIKPVVEAKGGSTWGNWKLIGKNFKVPYKKNMSESAYSEAIVRKLNGDSTLLKALSGLANKLDIDQVYVFIIDKQGIEYQVKNFKDFKFRFKSKHSDGGPNNIGFEMI